MTEATIIRKNSQQPDQENLSASQVADYLIHHPEFFQEHEHLLLDLILPHSNGSAISLIERQAHVMRERNSELRNRLSQLINTARENDTIFKLTKKLGLALLDADSLENVARAVRHSMLNDFKVDACNILIFDQPQLTSNELYSETSREAAKRVLGKLLRGERVICSALREEELAYLFPSFEQTSGSAAIIPLKHQQEIGLLAIASNDPAHYEPNMDTAFVAYIGQLVSRSLMRFLAPAPRVDRTHQNSEPNTE